MARFRVAVGALFAVRSGDGRAVVCRQAAGRGLLRVVYGRLDALKQQPTYVAARKLHSLNIRLDEPWQGDASSSWADMHKVCYITAYL